jgi:hypothetical protein
LFPDPEPAYCKLSDLKGYESVEDTYEVMANGDIRFTNDTSFRERCTWTPDDNGYLTCKLKLGKDSAKRNTVFKDSQRSRSQNTEWIEHVACTSR